MASVKLPPRTANQTLAGYLRVHLATLQRCADAGIPQAEIRIALERLGFGRVSAPTYWKELWRARRWARSRAESVVPAPARVVAGDLAATSFRAPSAQRSPLGLRRQFDTRGSSQQHKQPIRDNTPDDLPTDGGSAPEGLFSPRARARRKAEVDQFFNEVDPILNAINSNRNRK